MNNFKDRANFIWSIADLLRGDYKLKTRQPAGFLFFAHTTKINLQETNN